MPKRITTEDGEFILEADEEGEPRVIRVGNVIHFSDPSWPTLAADQGIVALQSVTDQDDYTELDLGEPEMFTIRQVDESGVVHTVCLSPKMTAELACLLDVAIQVGSSS